MFIEYNVRIDEKQHKLIMRALTTTLANNRHSTTGGVLVDAEPKEWMELIRIFGGLDAKTLKKMTLADRLQNCRHRLSCPHARGGTARDRSDAARRSPDCTQ